MQLIDADALKKSFCENCMCNTEDKLCGANCVVQQMIENAPTIEAEPVRHGKWEEHNRLYSDIYIDYACSKCHAISSGLDNYCPYCGARMDGDEDAAD